MNFDSRSILDAMPQGCQIIGFDWRYRYINLLAEKHNGRPKEELLGLTVMDCWPGITATRVFALEKSCMEERTTHQLDNEFIFPDGHRGWYRLTIQPVAEGIAIFSEEMTGQAALPEIAERLEFALESCQVGVWDISLVDHTAYRSLEHDRIFGYQELLPQWTLDDFLRHALPQYRAEVEAMVREATAAATGWTYQCEIRRADGEIRWIWFTGQHRVDGSGRSRVAGVVQDITERKRAEMALQENEKKISSIMGSMSEGLMLFDAEGNVVYQNPASLRIHGYQLDEPIEYLALQGTWKGWDEQGRPLDFTDWPISRVIRGEHVQEQVLQAQRTDTGHKFFASYNGTMIHDNSQTSAFGFITIHDITERMKGEEALKESKERLCLALNAARMAAWEYDPATLKVTLSEHAEEVLELPTRLDTSDTGYSLIHPDDVERHRALVTEAITTGGGYRSVYRHVHGEKTIWLEECGRTTVNREDNTFRLAGVVQNISERKRGEEAERHLLDVIAQEKDRLSALVDSITDEVWFADTAGQFRLVNPAGRRGFALQGTGAIDVHDLAASLEVRRPDGSPRPIEEAPSLRSLRGELVRGQEELIRLPTTGELRWRQVSSSPVRDSSGSIIGSVAVVRDITDYREAEQASRENKDRRQREFLECVIANVGACIGVMQGRDLRYTMANQAYQAFSPDKPIIGRTYCEVFPEAAEDGTERLLQHVLETGEPLELEAYQVAGPGMAGAIWQGQVVRLPAVPDEEASVLAVAWNITKLKRTEDKANNYARRLIEMEDDLRKGIARDLHDDVAQELTALSFNLAYVSRHMGGEAASKLRPILADSKEITKGVTRSVRMMMAELHPLQLEDNGLVIAIRMHAQQFANRFGIEVVVNDDPQFPRLTIIKETTIFRIAQEAMSNIVKHAAATRVTITLGKVGKFVRLTITDDGKGFEATEASPKTTETGWGLTNMRERARLIGGVLEVISNLGQGTTISLKVQEAR
ncbi:hypothetical protein GMLC_05480 [Geomonas limicola]|uniref:Histidine kinase n=1 Tax=Geomonas limicola TaxID=2740186 RepID=A0A6V8N6R6_9BACT|nr:PAS domain S-box protein [Geomonas limicola]GFO66969.1 hypothetical protein GMLC_05480 [Geomonas limicola]